MTHDDDDQNKGENTISPASSPLAVAPPADAPPPKKKKGLPPHLKPWKKGQSGNPGGRPKGLAADIRAKTNNLAAQIEMMIQISLGQVSKATVRDRIEATKWLADRGHGRSVETQIQVEADAKLADNLDISDEQLEQMVRTLKAG